jgi:hypothetical protein
MMAAVTVLLLWVLYVVAALAVLAGVLSALCWLCVVVDRAWQELREAGLVDSFPSED